MMQGLACRLLCVKTLVQTLKSHGYSNLALHAALSKSDLDAQEKRLCTMLYQGTLERLLTVDACIAAHSQRPLKKLDLPVLCVLRCGIYELLELHTPEAAVVNLWTEAVKSLRFQSASGMVNAILRKFLRSGKAIPLPKDEIGAWSVQYSVPKPLLEQLMHEYAREDVADFLEQSMGEPPVYIRRNPLLISEEALLVEMPELTSVPQIPLAYQVKRSGTLTETEGFRKGWFHVQDLASQLCCLAVDPQPGETVLDVCAAPGGKTFSMAEQMQNTGTLLAYDLHPHRVKLITDGANRLQLSMVQAKVGDAVQPDADRPMADRVLCDVPCSGFGVMRRKPEVRYKDLSELERLPEIQYAILDASAKAVRPGGVLVYSTCTLSCKENDAVVERFLAAHPEFMPERPWQQLPELAAFAQEKTTLFPRMLGTDGFFLCRMRKQEI